MDFLGHQFVQMLQHIGHFVGPGALPGLDIVEDRLLAQIEADHLGHIDIDRLVVGDARSGRRRQRHAAIAIDAEDARHAQQAVGAEDQRVDIFVVDTAIDDVDRLGAERRLHPDPVIVDEQIGRLDQFHAHQVGEEAMLIIGAVERAGRQHHHHRIALAGGRRDFLQALEQFGGIIVDRRDHALCEQLGEHARHDLAIFEHVGHARGGAAIILQHLEAARPSAHDIDADDMAIDLPRRGEVGHFGEIGAVAIDDVGRHDARLHDLAAMIDVVQEGVEGAGALADTLVEDAPFIRCEDAGQQVEGDQSFRVATLAIDGEGDADAPEDRFRLIHATIEPGYACPLHPFLHFVVTGAQRTIRLKHFMEGQVVVPPSALGRLCIATIVRRIVAIARQKWRSGKSVPSAMSGLRK